MENYKTEIGNNNCQNDIKYLKINNTIMNNPQEIANTFNDYFLTVVDTIIWNIRKGNGNPRDNMDPSNYLINNFYNMFPKINWNYATIYETDENIKYLKTKNSYGYDEIPPEILKLSAPFIISLLTCICNKANSSGVFLERPKYAIIKPVYKKGEKLLTSNYWPISLWRSFSKIFETLIYSRLYKHICTNNILVIQHGFRINSSIEAASVNVINEILEAVNNRLSVGGIFCDLEKALDCVNHGVLVGKLEVYGISGKFLTFIQSYFRGRYKKLLIDKINAYDNVSSRWKKSYKWGSSSY